MSGLNNFSSAHNDRLAEAVSVLKEFRREIFSEKTDSSSGVFQWTPPVFPENPSKSIKEPSLPTDYTVIGVDGSNIDVNRHIPVDCFLTRNFELGSETQVPYACVYMRDGKQKLMQSGHGKS